MPQQHFCFFNPNPVNWSLFLWHLAWFCKPYCSKMKLLTSQPPLDLVTCVSPWPPFQSRSNSRVSVFSRDSDLGKVSKKKTKKNGVGLLQPPSVYLPTPIGVQKAIFLCFLNALKRVFLMKKNLSPKRTQAMNLRKISQKNS